MHLTRASRQLVTAFCAHSLYHHLLVEFDCDAATLHDNVRETGHFRHQHNANSHNSNSSSSSSNSASSGTTKSTTSAAATAAATSSLFDWQQHLAAQFERCSAQLEGPLIAVHSSEDPMVHAVTARGVQGALQTTILGVLSSPVIRKQLFYFSRHGESDYNVLGRIGGDADLSSRGRSYADRLTKYLTGTAGVVAPKSVSE